MQLERHVPDVSGRKAPRRGITDSSASSSPTRYAPPSPKKIRPWGKLTSRKPATLAASTHAAENTTGSPAIHATTARAGRSEQPGNPGKAIQAVDQVHRSATHADVRRRFKLVQSFAPRP